ncbi:hypothetical protein OROHE_023496 [Orobanche hederae]
MNISTEHFKVRLFLSEESPSHVVLDTQDHLQGKASWPLQSGDDDSDDNLPPGFKRIQPANPWRLKLSQIPLIKWGRPLRFGVNIEWQVAAGEESKEVEAQNQREMRVLEAIYPRPSSIPSNPSGLVNAENPIASDKNTPVVPVTPIEDDNSALDTPFNLPTPNPSPMISPPQTPSCVTSSLGHPNALAALTTVLSNKNQANLVDGDLLVRILSDPKLVVELVKNHGVSSSSVPSVGIQNGPSLGSQNKPFNMHHMPPNPTPPTSNGLCTPYMATSSGGPFYPNPQISTPSPSLVAPLKKDMNYYRSLIKQHGKERRDGSSSQEQQQEEEDLSFVKSRESKPKIMKSCIYFNSSKGCRNGANCAYQHDMSSRNGVGGFPGVRNAKRVKLDGGITGR